MRQGMQILAIYPRIKCYRCERLTDTAYWKKDGEFDFEPVCPEHGHIEFPEYDKYPTKRHKLTREERRLLHYCIERFVVWYHSDLGRVTDISPIAPEQVPGWTQSETELYSQGKLLRVEADWTVAWKVRHETKEETTIGYVTYDTGDYAFTWFPEAAEKEQVSE